MDCRFRHPSTEEITKNNIDSSSGEEEDQNLICGVCFDNIPAEGKRYGILTSCDHVFCLPCTQTWRRGRNSAENGQVVLESVRMQNRKTCPNCRQLSELVVPSRDFVTGANKDSLIKAYKESLSKIKCQNFDPATKSGCNFATNCLYAHKNEQGEDIKAESKPLRQQLDSGEDNNLNYDDEDVLMLRMLARIGLFNYDTELNEISMHIQNIEGEDFMEDERSDSDGWESYYLGSDYGEDSDDTVSID